ncbi:hypothetical protein ABPG72_022851 [Tetrahymena utriculariae]
MSYSFEERVFMVQNFNKTNSITLVQRAWRTHYVCSQAPSYSVIMSTVKRFQETGSVESIWSNHEEQQNEKEEIKEQLKEMYKENPSLSIRQASKQIRASVGYTHNIVRNDLGLKPYKIQEVNEIKDPDFIKRIKFCEWYLDLPNSEQQLVIFSDESYFSLNQTNNKQNDRMWLPSKPNTFIEKVHFADKLHIWCAISSTKVYGPYYFENNVNSDNYLEMLQNFFIPLHKKVKNHRNYYFQQDGASSHTASKIQNYLKQQFGEKFIEKEFWPPRSPDLNPCDFYLWGHLKSKVYTPSPSNIDELKQNIEREIKNISKETLLKVFMNLAKRCESVITNQGSHIEPSFQIEQQ